jgi:molecular chaperone Hsp33
MPDPDTDIPVRAPSETSADDTILPFEVAALDLRGRVVRLGPMVDDILRRHAYPAPVSKLVGEAIVLTVLLGSVLKFAGRFILQTQSDGPVRMLVVDYTTPGKVRALAGFDRTASPPRSLPGLTQAPARPRAPCHDHRGPDTARYQGLVALEGKTSNMWRTNISCARSRSDPGAACVGEELSPPPVARGTAGGPADPGAVPAQAFRARQGDLDPGDAPEGTAPHVVAEDEAWIEGRSLVGTVEDVELIDPAVSAERLVYRLFHERGVRVFRSRELAAVCSCSRESVTNMLKSFSQDDRDHMVEDGVIKVTCEFCSSTYVFEPGEVADTN